MKLKTETKLRFLLSTFTLIFILRISTIFVADRAYCLSYWMEKGYISQATAEILLDIAIKLDSTNALLFFRKYEVLRAGYEQSHDRDVLLKQLRLIEKCVELCPSWPAYHLHYAITLKKTQRSSNIITQELISSELKKAAELKPYSEKYQDIYQKYGKPFSLQEPAIS